LDAGLADHAAGRAAHLAADRCAFVEGASRAAAFVRMSLAVAVGTANAARHRVGNLPSAGFLANPANRVGDLLDAGFTHHAADRIRDLLDHRIGNLAADRVGNALANTFANISRARNLLADAVFAPDLAAALPVGLLATNFVPTAPVVNGAAGARIEAASIR